MTTEVLRKLHTAVPFQPFSVRLADGQAIAVRHPEMLAYAPNSRTMTVYLANGSFEIIDLLLVCGLEVTNGRRHTRTR